MVLSLLRLGTFTAVSFSCGPKGPRRRLGPLTCCPPRAWRQSREGRRRSRHRVHPHGPRNGCQPGVRRQTAAPPVRAHRPHRSAERRSAHLNFGSSVRSVHNKVPGVSRSQPGRSREQYEMSTDGQFFETARSAAPDGQSTRLDHVEIGRGVQPWLRSMHQPLLGARRQGECRYPLPGVRSAFDRLSASQQPA
jgi:hypothetical protein